MGRDGRGTEEDQGVKATLERREGWQAVLTVEVEPERVEAAMGEACRRLARRVKVPGFRPGRAPRAVLERHLGREALWDEAAGGLCTGAVAEAAVELGLEPIARPAIEILERGDGRPLRFRATVAVRPEVELGEYRSLAVPVDDAEVAPEEAARYIEELRERHALLRPLTGAAAPGHVVRFSYRGSAGGRVVSSGEEGRLARLGAGELVPALEEALTGARPGEAREVTFRSQGEGDDAGEEVRLKVRVLEVCERVLPEPDDEFARGIGPYETMDQLRQAVMAHLRREAERRALERHRARVLERLVEGSRVEVPPPLVERRLGSLVRRWFEEARILGLSPERYRQARGFASEEEWRQMLVARAGREVRAELVLDALAAAEGVSAAETEVEERLRAEGLDPSDGEMRAAVRRTIMREKVLTWLAETAAANAAGMAGGGDGGETAPATAGQ